MEQTEIDIKSLFSKIFKYLYKKKYVFILSFLLSAIIGFFYRQSMGTSYKASLTFVTDNGGKDKLSGYAGIAAQFGIDLGQGGSGAFEGENLIQLFVSYNLISKTLYSKFSDDSLLIEKYFSHYELWKNLIIKKRYNKSFFRQDSKNVELRYRDSLTNLLYKKIIKEHLSINKGDKKLDFITIDFIGKDEDFNKAFIEKLCDNAIKFYTEYKVKKATQNVALLQGQVDSLRGLLSSSISGFALANDLNVNPIKQVAKVNSQNLRINMEAASAMYTEIVKQLALAKITLRRETPLIQIIDSPILPLEKVGKGRLAYAIIFGLIGVFLTIAYFVIKKISFGKN